jgi:acyl carrier protein
MTAHIADAVRRFIEQNFYVEDAARLASDTSLVSEGIVDSTGMLEVIAFLETEFKIRVEDHETVPANLESIGRIVEFVSRKQQVRASA